MNFHNYSKYFMDKGYLLIEPEHYKAMKAWAKVGQTVTTIAIIALIVFILNLDQLF